MELKGISNMVKFDDIVFSDDSKTGYYFIDSIGEIKLSKPIKFDVLVNPDNDGDYIINCEELRIWGFGKYLHILVDEIEEDLVDLYNDLFIDQHKLGYPMTEVKKFIEERI